MAITAASARYKPLDAVKVIQGDWASASVTSTVGGAAVAFDTAFTGHDGTSAVTVDLSTSEIILTVSTAGAGGTVILEIDGVDAITLPANVMWRAAFDTSQALQIKDGSAASVVVNLFAEYQGTIS